MSWRWGNSVALLQGAMDSDGWKAMAIAAWRRLQVQKDASEKPVENTENPSKSTSQWGAQAAQVDGVDTAVNIGTNMDEQINFSKWPFHNHSVFFRLGSSCLEPRCFCTLLWHLILSSCSAAWTCWRLWTRAQCSSPPPLFHLVRPGRHQQDPGKYWVSIGVQ